MYFNIKISNKSQSAESTQFLHCTISNKIFAERTKNLSTGNSCVITGFNDFS